MRQVTVCALPATGTEKAAAWSARRVVARMSVRNFIHTKLDERACEADSQGRYATAPGRKVVIDSVDV